MAVSARESPRAFGITVGNGAHNDAEVRLLETVWVGVLAIPVGSLKPADEMRAHFAMFMEFSGDKIVAQRNYDCFEPF